FPPVRDACNRHVASRNPPGPHRTGSRIAEVLPDRTLFPSCRKSALPEEGSATVVRRQKSDLCSKKCAYRSVRLPRFAIRQRTPLPQRSPVRKDQWQKAIVSWNESSSNPNDLDRKSTAVGHESTAMNPRL